MYTAAQAREDVKKYETHIRLETLDNLLAKEDNVIALQIFEPEIENQASKGCTVLIASKGSELYDLIETTDIKTILKFLGYNIESQYGDKYIIKW